MKTVLITTLVMLAMLLVFVPSIASAVSVVPCTGSQAIQGLNKTTVCNDTATQTSNNNNIVIEIIKDAINVLSFAVGVISVFVIIISGFRMIINGSNPQEISKARTAIFTALGGIFVVALAQLIVLFVLDKVS